MTNKKIVISEALAQGAFTQKEIDKYINRKEAIPLFTLQVWRRKGYRVKKGEHAKVITELWDIVKKPQGKDAVGTTDFVLRKAYLFGPEQVEKIPEREGTNEDHAV